MKRQNGDDLIQIKADDNFLTVYNTNKYNFEQLIIKDQRCKSFLIQYHFKPVFTKQVVNKQQIIVCRSFNVVDQFQIQDDDIDYIRALGSEAQLSFLNSSRYNSEMTIRDLPIQSLIPGSNFLDFFDKLELQSSYCESTQDSHEVLEVQPLLTVQNTQQLKLSDLLQQVETSADEDLCKKITYSFSERAEKRNVLGPLQLTARKSGKK